MNDLESLKAHYYVFPERFYYRAAPEKVLVSVFPFLLYKKKVPGAFLYLYLSQKVSCWQSPVQKFKLKFTEFCASRKFFKLAGRPQASVQLYWLWVEERLSLEQERYMQVY